MHRFVITKSNIGNIEKESEQLTEIEHYASNEQLPVSNNLSAENSTSTCNNAVIENKEGDQPAEIEINEQQSIDLSAENCARTCNEPVAEEKEGELLAENEENTEPLSHDVLAENDTSTFIQPAVTELVLTPNNSSELPHELKDVGEWPPSLNAESLKLLLHVGPDTIESSFEFSSNINGRRFSHSFFFQKMKNGDRYLRSWLVYSKIKDCVYCFSCKLFSTSDYNLATTGCNDWQHIGTILAKHEVSSKHLQSMLTLKQMIVAEQQKQSISSLLTSQYTIQVTYWRNVLRRILDIIIYLAQHNIALRGTAGHESLGDPKNGPFLGLVELLGKYDPVMEEHVKKIQNAEIHDHYLGKTIQNELIELVANKILNNICEAVNKCKYFLIILDCTPDVSHQEQMTIVIRYVDVLNNTPCIKEHFVGFVNV